MKLSEIAVQYHKTLNPKLWKDFELIPEVKAQLVKIAAEFVEFLAIDNSYIKDLVITGSNCNYNWTSSSDIDLHVVIDYEEFQQGCDSADTEELFNTKKTLWNDTHDITIYEIPVELYVQDDIGSNSKDGVVYSIGQEKWLVQPKKYENLVIDDAKVTKVYNSIKAEIEKVLKQKDMEKVNTLKKSISDARKNALALDGEFGVLNLAYKKLRKDQIMQKLWDASIDLQDDELSLD